MSGAPSGEWEPGGPLVEAPPILPAAAKARWRDRFARLRRAVRPFARPILLAATGLSALVLAEQLYRTERDIVTVALDLPAIAYVAACAGFLASLGTLVTRRRLAPPTIVFGALALLGLLSVVKYRYVRSNLVLSDFWTYATPGDLQALVRLFPSQVALGLATLAGFGLAGALLFALDTTRVSRRRAGAAVLITGLAVVAAFAWRGPQGRLYHYFAGHHLSSLLASGPETLWRPGHLEAADLGGRIDSEPAARIVTAAAAKPPILISILHESLFPINLFPVSCGGRTPGPLYTSSDGRRYDLRVETYNGATWMTEYGLLTGLSTYYLGDNRIWLGDSMAGKFRDSLPRQLQRHGYRNVAVYPSGKSFVNTGAFYPSLGFDRLIDLYDLKAPSEFERDRYYYGKVLDEIRAHRASGSDAPLFVFAWTNASHAPYDHVAHPEVESGPVCGKDAGWSEYIRRLLMAEDDLAWLTAQLKAEFPDEPFLILGYGDHHPLITEEFLEPNPSKPFTPVRGSLGYKTFFRLTGVNYEPDFEAVPDSVDTPFLGNVLMRAARLTRHGFYTDRDKLLDLCHGRYSDCPHQDEILSFHDRLVKAGAVVNR